MPRPYLTAHLFVTFTECFETVYSNKVRVLNVLKEFVLSGTLKNLRWNSLLMVSEISLSKRAYINRWKVSRQTDFFSFHTPRNLSLKQKQFHIPEYATFHLGPCQWILPVKYPPWNFSLWITPFLSQYPLPPPWFFFIYFFHKLATRTSSLFIKLIVYLIIVTRKTRI